MESLKNLRVSYLARWAIAPVSTNHHYVNPTRDGWAIRNQTLQKLPTQLGSLLIIIFLLPVVCNGQMGNGKGNGNGNGKGKGNFSTTAPGTWQAANNWSGKGGWPNKSKDKAQINHMIDVTKYQKIGEVSFNNGGELEIINGGTLFINNSLDLTNGSVSVDSTSNLILAEGATLKGLSNANYIDGPYTIKGKDSLVFHLKGANGLVKLAIFDLQTSSKFKVSYQGQDPHNAVSNSMATYLSSISHQEYFNINRTSGSGTVRIALFWNQQGTNTKLTNLQSLNDLTVSHYNGTKWEAIGNLYTVGQKSDSGYIASDTISNFSPFTFASTNSKSTLPVELKYFKAKSNARNSNTLKWATASETNNAYFRIQRKNESSQFENIGRLQGNGTTVKEHIYTFQDHHVPTETVYYRLKQVDYDGSHSYSKVQSVGPINAQAEKEQIEVHPNPIKPSSTVKFYVETPQTVQVKLFNGKGTRIWKGERAAQKGHNQISMESIIENLTTNGTYSLVIDKHSESVYKKLLKLDKKQIR